MGDMPSFNNKGCGQYTSGSKMTILATFPYVAMNFEYVTINIASYCPQIRTSCDLIGLIAVVKNISFLERQDHRQEQINSRSKDDGQ